MNRSFAKLRLGLCFGFVLLVAALPASAQPFGAWAGFNGTHGYIEIPHSSALGPTSAMTIEAWVNLGAPSGQDCISLVGKSYVTAYWVGICSSGSGDRALRSYVKGSGSARTAGVVPLNQWTHIAVVYGGGLRRHYINGELALEVADSGDLTTNLAPVRIGSDVSWPYSPTGSIDDVRIWNVARTQAQIRAALNEIQSPQEGLVANWRLDGNPNDSIGGYNGVAAGAILAQTFPVAVGCTSTASTLCLRNRFTVNGEWRVEPDTYGDIGVVPYQTPESGLMHFFGTNNWEIQIKVLDGCGLNDHYWVYYAASTTLYFRLEVFDREAGVQKIYFNYPGEPAVAVTEIEAFPTCD